MKCKLGKYLGQDSQHARMAALLIIGLAATPLAATAIDNNVHLYGALVAEPCIIAPGKDEIQLDFGTIIDKFLYTNKRTSTRQFEIYLTGCDLSLGKTVKATFQGTESSALPGLLAVDAGSQARGIAIGLETLDAKPLPFNKASGEFTLQSGDTHIKLRAYVQGEPDSVASQTIVRGPFSATATFSLEYQ